MVTLIYSFFSFRGIGVIPSLIVITAFLLHVSFQYWVRGNANLMLKPCKETVTRRLSMKAYETVTTMLLFLFIATNVVVMIIFTGSAT